MVHRSKIKKHRQRRMAEVDPLEEFEAQSGIEASEKVHEKAEKPTKFPKKIRSGPKESYRPMKRR